MTIKLFSGLGQIAPPPQGTRSTGSVSPQQYSQDSAPGTFETFFSDFQLEALPFYNFWVPDETTNDRDAQGNRALADVPRFIKVVWNPVPAFPDVQLEPKDLRVRSGKPIKFSAELEKKHSLNVKGVNFAPAHLQPENFSMVRSNLANGFLAPGVLEALVEMPVRSTEDASEILDEDTFLSHPDSEGIAVNELKANLIQNKNSLSGIQRLAGEELNSSSRQSSEVWNGKIAVSLPDSSGGKVSISSTSADTPVLTMNGSSITKDQKDSDPLLDFAAKFSAEQKISDSRSSYLKIKFVNPAVAGVVSEDKSSSVARPEHVENLVAISQVLPYLEVLNASGLRETTNRYSVPVFSSPAGLKPLDCVGYVLEKYRRNVSGVFQKVAEIELPDANYSEYYDCQILYGEVYRYRIRAIFRWTHPKGQGIDSDEVVTVSYANSLAPFESSYFGGEWGPGWAYASVLDLSQPSPPDELTVRSESPKKVIWVSFKLPEDLQRDISSMVLYRKLRNGDGKDLTGWKQVAESEGSNLLYCDQDVDFFQTNGVEYVYSGQSFTHHGEASALSEQIGCSLNRDYSSQGEFPNEFVSCKGVKLQSFGAFSVQPPKRVLSEVSVPLGPSKKMSVAVTGRTSEEGSPFQDGSYILRIESLDTGEKRDHIVSVDYNNVRAILTGSGIAPPPQGQRSTGPVPLNSPKSYPRPGNR